MKKTAFIIIVVLFLAGCVHTHQNDLTTNLNLPDMLEITSLDFTNNSRLPDKITCNGSNVSPQLSFSNVPQGTKSLVVVVDDPDVPSGVWTHWIVYNIDPMVREIAENSIPSGALLGVNDFKVTEYRGACPPSGNHHYIFRVYALSGVLDLPAGASRSEIDEAIKDSILDYGELVGTYSRE